MSCNKKKNEVEWNYRYMYKLLIYIWEMVSHIECEQVFHIIINENLIQTYN